MVTATRITPDTELRQSLILSAKSAPIDKRSPTKQEERLGSTSIVFAWLMVVRMALTPSDIEEVPRSTDSSPLVAPGSTSKLDRVDVEDSKTDMESIYGGFKNSEGGHLESARSGHRRQLLAKTPSHITPELILNAHEQVAKSCLNLLSSPKTSITPPPCTRVAPLVSHKSQSSLVEYAMENWHFHYRMAEPHSKVLAGILHEQLTKSITIDERLSGLGYARQGHISTLILHTSAYYGFPALAQICLEMGVSPNFNSCRCQKTPLAIALANDQMEVARVLEQRGATESHCSDNGQEGDPARLTTCPRRDPKPKKLLQGSDEGSEGSLEGWVYVQDC